MPLYRNPDFRRLPSGLADVFYKCSGNSFFSLPAWYDLMSRHGVLEGTEIRIYTDERPASATAILLQNATGKARRSLVSLTNAHSPEHATLTGPGADLDAAIDAVLSEIFAERPQWDCLRLAELDPRDASYAILVGGLRRAGLFVESTFDSGTWYEDTAGLSFADYLAARPSELRNTWRRKRRTLDRSNRLTTGFFGYDLGLDQALADYQTIYAASWKPPEYFPEFVPGLIRLAGPLGALRLGIYYIDRVPAAAQFWILWNSRAVICKLAHDKRFDDLSRHPPHDGNVRACAGRGSPAGNQPWARRRPV